jgi:hypothetical protein
VKNNLGLVALAIVVAVFAAIYVWMSQTRDPAKTGQVYQFGSDENLREISLINDYGRFTFTKENNLWAMTQPGQYRVNQQKINIMEDFILNLPVKRIIDTELEEYGFSHPAATIKFLTSKNTQNTFLIGQLTSSKAQVYIKDIDSKQIFVCDIGSLAQFSGSLTAFRDKEILTIDKTHIVAITYFKEGIKQISINLNDDKDWQISFPYSAPARDIELNEILAKIRGWSVAGYPTDTNIDLTTLGLEKPANSLEIVDSSGKKQLVDFGKTEDGMIYVRTGSNQDIVKLFSVDIDFDKLSPERLLFLLPLNTTIKQAAKIEIRFENRDAIFEIDGSVTPPLITSDGKNIPYEDFVSLFVKYIMLSADGHDLAGKPGEQYMLLKTTLHDGSTRMLRLFKRDKASFYLEIDGKTEFFLNGEKVKQLIYQIDRSMAAKKM